MESPNSPTPKKARQAKTKVRSMFIIFFDIRGIVHKEFDLTGQTSIPDTTVTFKRLRPDQKNWLLHHDNAPSHTSFFTRAIFFTINNMTVFPTHLNFFSFPSLRKKMKGCHFDTTEVTEA
jgi:hypothetical protein